MSSTIYKLVDNAETEPQRLLHRTLRTVGWAILAIWACWWVVGFYQSHLPGLERTWVRIPCFGIDYTRNVDQPSRIWVAGNDPYADPVLKYCYPPLVLPFFAWSSLMSPSAALAVWLTVLGSFAAAGAYAAWRTRHQLGLTPIPLVWAFIGVLVSTPVLFAMERANYDLVSIPLIIAAVALLGRKSKYAEIIGGALLAIAPWMKVYPGLLGVGLLSLRRWRALTSFAVTGAAIAIIQLPDTLRFLDANRKAIDEVYVLAAAEPHGRVCAWQHSLTELWPKFWRDTPLHELSRIPGMAMTALVLLPLLAWVSYRIFRSSERGRLAYPYLLWVLALASFVPPIANDYSLISLPMAVLAVWDRRDSRSIQIAIALLLLWWQPLALPIDTRLLFLTKLLGLSAVGAILVERARQLTTIDVAVPHEPAVLSVPRKAAA